MEDVRRSHPIEPFRIKAIEPIPLLSRDARDERLRDAGYNLFGLQANDVTIDLLTDSGTGAMSAGQWSALFSGDESYAGSRSFIRFEKTVRDLTGYDHVIPVHQGRAAEHLLFSILLNEGDIVLANTHFDTTAANVLYRNATPIDLPNPACADLDSPDPFKGNIDLERLETLLGEHRSKVKFCIMTITNNTVGGQPVSLANIEAARTILNRFDVPLYLDAARFAENAWFVQQREPSQSQRSIRDIARAFFECADGCLISAKKDGLANIGGFLALRDNDLATSVRERMLVLEGFPSYGGLAGRDLEAIASGLEEVTDPAYLSYRIGQTAWFGEELAGCGARVVRPIGGHAVYIDAGALYPQIPSDQFPGQALCVALYREGGVRSAEIGSLMFGSVDQATATHNRRPELIRLALPRRVYTESHLRYVVDVFRRVYECRHEAVGFAIEYEPKYLRHFTVRLRELPVSEKAPAPI